MEISKIQQAPEQIVVSAHPASTPRAGEKTGVADGNVAVQQDFQVNLQDGLKMKLAEFATILQNREQLIQSLPEDIKKAVVELLGQMSADTELPQGLVNMIKGQKNTSEQLKELSNILGFSAELNKDENSEVKTLLQKTYDNFTQQGVKTPEQCAKELAQLVKQLPTNNAVSQGNVSNALEQLFEQTVPENRQQINQNQQKSLVKLANLLGQDMPTQLQQLTKQNNLPELPGVWAIVKMADAWPFKEIQPKTLQVAADLLKQIAQEMSPEKGAAVTQLEQFVQLLPPEVNNKGTVAARLEQFVKTLPPEIGKALEQALKQGNIPDSLRGLAEKFSNAIVLHDNMKSDLQAFGLKNGETFSAKSPLMSADASTVLIQLANQFADVNTTVEQLKTLMQQLKAQLFASDPKLLENKEHMLDQITKLLEPIIPQMLQEGVVKHKLPELPKIWTLLTALGSEQWKGLESQDLQKYAAVVKELAQSIYKSTGLTGEKQIEHSTLSFSVPMQVAEGIYYPAHIHIYHEQKESSSPLTQREFETWLRVSVDTENIGMVDSVFRLYGDNKLDVRVNFSDKSASHQFSQQLPDIKKSLDGTKLTLADIMINKA